MRLLFQLSVDGFVFGAWRYDGDGIDYFGVGGGRFWFLLMSLERVHWCGKPMESHRKWKKNKVAVKARLGELGLQQKDSGKIRASSLCGCVSVLVCRVFKGRCALPFSLAYACACASSGMDRK